MNAITGQYVLRRGARGRTRWLVVTLAALACQPLVTEARAEVLPPDALIDGRSQLDWAEQWWVHLFGIPAAVNPILDPTGEQAFRGDAGPVFFLYGAFTSDPITRTIDVQAGKTLFLPLLNSYFDNVAPFGDPQSSFTPEEMLALISPGLEPGAVSLFATIDGVDVLNLVDHRQTTDPNNPISYTLFSPENLQADFGLDPTNGTGIYPATISPAVQDGYYLALKPFEVGTTRVLRFGGTSASGSSIDITYVLTTVPEPSSIVMLSIGALALAGVGWRRRGGTGDGKVSGRRRVR